MTDKLRELADTAMDIASKAFEADGECGAPSFILDDGKELTVVVAPMSDNETKNAVAQFIREELAVNAVRIAHVAEAWLRTTRSPYDGIAPSKDPNREEAIFVAAEDNTGRQLAILRKIKREGKTATLGPIEELDEGHGGRFSGLLKPVATRH